MGEQTENIPGTGNSICRGPRLERALTDAEKSRAETAVTQGQGRQAPSESRTFSWGQEKFGLHSKYSGKPLQALGERHDSLFIALLYAVGCGWKQEEQFGGVTWSR